MDMILCCKPYILQVPILQDLFNGTHLPEGDHMRVSQDAVVQDLPLRVVVYELRSARSIGRKPDSSARSQAAWHFM